MIDVVSVDAVKEIVDKGNRFTIIVHRNPDGDAIGSALAWAHYLRLKGKFVDIIAPNSFPDFLKWLLGSDNILLYDTMKNDADALLRSSDAIFCLDFNAMSRVADIADVVNELDIPRLLIDHHLYPENNFTVSISNITACSTAELVYRLIYALGDDDMLNKDMAESIYTGIMTDTGNFAYASNRKEIYIIVARLIEAGIDKDKIYRRVFYNYSIDRLRLFGFVMNEKLQVFSNYNASIMTLSHNEIKRFNAVKGDTEGLVNMPLQIKGLRFSCFLREEYPGKINVSLRSVDDFPCNKVAAEFFGGGGHKNASGGEYIGRIEDAVALFKEAIAKYSNELTN